VSEKRRRRKYSRRTLYACDLCHQHVAVVVSRRKGWVVWLPRCIRKEETKEKSRHTFYAHGVSHLWFAAVNCCRKEEGGVVAGRGSCQELENDHCVKSTKVTRVFDGFEPV